MRPCASSGIPWLLAALALGGCAGDDRRFDPEPLFPSTEAASVQPKESPNPAKLSGSSAWISLDLPAVLALAGAKDLEIGVAVERLAELRAREDEALFRFFPTLQSGISFRRAVGEYQATSGEFVDVTRQQTLVGIRARLAVALGDAIYGLTGAGHAVAGGGHELKSRRHERLMQASRRYYDLLAAVQRIEIARDALRFGEAQLAFHESRHAQGFGLALDVEQARARVEGEKTNLVDSEMRFRAASNGLALQLRLDPRITLYPDDGTVAAVELVSRELETDELIRLALQANPGLDAAREHLLEAEAMLDAARYGWLIPHLFIEGSFDERGENLGRLGDTDQFLAGIAWEISLGQGARERSALARRNQVAIALARARERLVATLVTVQDRLSLTLRRIAASERRITAAQAALRFAESRMRAGSGLFLDVLEARVELTESRLARLDALTDYNKDQVGLLVLTGSSPDRTGSSER